VLLAGGLVYTSFSASSEVKEPSQLAAGAAPGRTYKLTGKVVAGWHYDGKHLLFRVRDRGGPISVPVRYTGVKPDPFRTGREVIVDVHKAGDTFIGERDTLVTKCPSKFKAEKQPG